MANRIRKHHDFMWSYFKSLLIRILERPAFIFLGGVSFTVIVFFSLLIFWIEHVVNPKMERYLDALYFTVATLTSVGYGDIAPVTFAGRIVAILMMLLGTFIFVSFTGVVGSTVIELEMERKITSGSDPENS
ncbi:two pore domain potassium channel family protein [bacterium]|jgi:voltage-gated potassium channel|nr:two pore domain potassium channel family protein [bacterium]